MSSVKNTQIDGDVSVGRNVSIGGNTTIQGKGHVKGSFKVDGWLEAKNIKGANKGVFTTVEKLREAYPRPHDGWWAIVGRSLPSPVYVAEGGVWVATGENGGNPTVDIEQYGRDISGLQDDLNATKADVKSIEGEVKTLRTQVTTQGDSVNQAHTAIDALRQAVDSAKKTATETYVDLTRLKTSKGVPDGIAPLDRKGKIPADHLPSYVDDVIEFDGCMDNLTVQQAGVDMLSTDEHAKVIYNRTDNVFVLAVKTQENENTIYYASWPDQDTYGVSSRNGFAPISGKIYVDTSTNITYRWSGTKLVPIGSDLALGYTAGTAFPGNEGAELKQRYIRDVEILNEDLTDTAQTIREMQSAISTNTTSLNDLTTRVGSMETNSTRTAAVMAAVKVSVDGAKASAEAAKAAVEGVKTSSTTTDGKTLEDVYTIAKDAANRESAPRVEVVQATGDAEDKVMSQKAVTEALKGVGGTSSKEEVMKLRQLNENFFIRTSAHFIKTKLIPIPEGTKSLDFDVTKLKEKSPQRYDCELFLYNQLGYQIDNIRYRTGANPMDDVLHTDISSYTDAKFYELGFYTREFDNISSVDAYTLLPITDTDFAKLNVPIGHHSLSQLEKNRAAWAAYTRDGNEHVGLLHLGCTNGDVGMFELARNFACDLDDIKGIFNLGGVGADIYDFVNNHKDISNIIKTSRVPFFMAMSMLERHVSSSFYNVVSSDCFYRTFIEPLTGKERLYEGWAVENECYYKADLGDFHVYVLNPYDNDDLKENEYWEPVDYNESYPQAQKEQTYTYDENNPVFINFFPYTKHSFRLKKTVTTESSDSTDTMPRVKVGDYTCFSQKQLEWFCGNLLNNFNSFMIAASAPVCQGMTVVSGKMSHTDRDFTSVEDNFPTAMETDVIKEILKAYKSRGELDIKVRYKEDGPAAYLNTQTDEEGRKYAFKLQHSFSHAYGSFRGFLGGYMTTDGMIIKESECGFCSVHAPYSSTYGNIGSQGTNKYNTYTFNVVGMQSGADNKNSLFRIARIGYDMNEDGSVDDVLELKN